MVAPMIVRPRMQDIADETGLGKATVSLALRDDPRIRPETRRRVKAVAERLGYVADPTVASMMTQLRVTRGPRKNLQPPLAFVHSHPTDALPISLRRLWAGANRRAKELGFETEIFPLHPPGVSAAQRLQDFESRGIRGILWGAGCPEDLGSGENAVLWEPFAHVTMGQRISLPRLHFAGNDYHGTVFMAMSEMLRLGYQRLGLAISKNTDRSTDLRFGGGFWAGAKALLAAENCIPPLYVTSPDEFLAWFRTNQPDAILTTDENVLQWLMGEPQGTEIGFAHLDWHPGLTNWAGIDQRHEIAGASAVDMLVEQIHHNKRGVPPVQLSTLISGKWMAGGSRI